MIGGSYSYIWVDESVVGSNGDGLGQEIDLQATYDYTEDVSFGLLVGWFMPGEFYIAPANDTATDVVGSLKVSF